MREIVFSQNAGKALMNLLDYVETNWSLKAKNNFISKLDKSIFRIQTNPELFSKSEINKRQH